MPDEELIIDFRISLMSISYNKKGEMIGLSYRTNLPLSIPVKVAIAIIQEYVIEHCVNYSEVIWDAFDNGDFKEAVGYILIEEIINA